MWNKDESKILTTSADGTVRTWYMHMTDLLDAACTNSARNLTWNEWRRFMNDESYRPTCIDSLIPPDAIEAIQADATDSIKAGEIVTAMARLDELNGWLEVNGQFNDYAQESHLFIVTTLLEQGSELIRDDDIDGAIASFEKAIELDGSLGLHSLSKEAYEIAVDTLVKQGRKLANDGKMKAAIANFEKAIELDETLVDRLIAKSLISLGRSLAQRRLLDAALVQVNMAVSLDKTLDSNTLIAEFQKITLQALIALIRTHISEGNTEDASTRIAEAITIADALNDTYLTWSICRMGTEFESIAAVVNPACQLLISQTQPLTWGVPVTATTKLTSFWHFIGAANDVVTISLIDIENGDFDPRLALMDADGRIIVGDDNSGGGQDGRDALIEDVILLDDGVYFVWAGAPGSTTIYELTVSLAPEEIAIARRAEAFLVAGREVAKEGNVAGALTKFEEAMALDETLDWDALH